MCVCVSVQVVAVKTPEDLDKHAKVLYDWAGGSPAPSRIRLIMYWQSSGGLSYVANVHHRMTQAWISCGERNHVGEQANVPGAAKVSLETFQACIKERHRIGHDGLSQSSEGMSQADGDLASISPGVLGGG